MENKDTMKVLLEEISLKIMGQALDLARIGIQNEKALKQYERSLRSHCRQLIESGKRMIDESYSH